MEVLEDRIVPSRFRWSPREQAAGLQCAPRFQRPVLLSRPHLIEFKLCTSFEIIARCFRIPQSAEPCLSQTAGAASLLRPRGAQLRKRNENAIAQTQYLASIGNSRALTSIVDAGALHLLLHQ
jgi:hypothetical protein